MTMGRNKRKVAMATASQPATRNPGKGNNLVSTNTPKRSRDADRPIRGQHSWKRTSIILTLLAGVLAATWHYLYHSKRESVNLDLGKEGHATFDSLSGDIIAVPSHQKASLFKPYAVDLQELLRERERNMQKYSYNYSRSGIDRRSDLSLQEFRDVYDGKWPVIITDVVPRWNAFNWSRDFFFENYGQERVTMKAVDEVLDQVIPEVLPDVYPFTADLDLHTSGNKQNSLDQAVSLALPLELFYKNTHKAFPNRWTYVEDELFIPSRPQLRKDIGDCDYLQEDFYQLFPQEVRPWNAMLLWGTKYSRSSLHIDPYNWTGTNAVFKGRKRWKMFPPGQDHLLYVMAGRKSGFPLNCYKYNSPLDGFDPDFTKFSSYLKAEQLEFDQLPGELLLIPTGWFHQAFNIEETIAVSSQVMNRNNYRIVLEEIIKVGNIKRTQLPPDIDSMSPPEQVQTVMSLLPQHVLDRGRHVTNDALYQIQHAHEDKRYQLPLDD